MVGGKTRGGSWRFFDESPCWEPPAPGVAVVSCVPLTTLTGRLQTRRSPAFDYPSDRNLSLRPRLRPSCFLLHVPRVWCKRKAVPLNAYHSTVLQRYRALPVVELHPLFIQRAVIDLLRVLKRGSFEEPPLYNSTTTIISPISCARRIPLLFVPRVLVLCSRVAVTGSSRERSHLQRVYNTRYICFALSAKVCLRRPCSAASTCSVKPRTFSHHCLLQALSGTTQFNDTDTTSPS